MVNEVHHIRLQASQARREFNRVSEVLARVLAGRIDLDRHRHHAAAPQKLLPLVQERGDRRNLPAGVEQVVSSLQNRTTSQPVLPIDVTWRYGIAPSSSSPLRPRHHSRQPRSSKDVVLQYYSVADTVSSILDLKRQDRIQT
jgi:hypothetical protein